jgi:hypothetical protein
VVGGVGCVGHRMNALRYATAGATPGVGLLPLWELQFVPWGQGSHRQLRCGRSSISRLLICLRLTGDGKGGLGPTQCETQSSAGIGDRGCDPRWWGTVLRVAAIVTVLP